MSEKSEMLKLMECIVVELRMHNKLLGERNDMLRESVDLQMKNMKANEVHNERVQQQFEMLQLLRDHPVVEEVLLERARQVVEEEWSPERDDKVHSEGQLAQAAACYAVVPHDIVWPNQESVWPWDDCWDKRDKHGQRRCLVIAAALLVAEIERLDRKNGAMP